MRAAGKIPILFGLLLVVGCAPPACSDAEERALEADVALLVKDDGPLSREAAERLVARGDRSIAVLETGLYGATPAARRRIIKVLERIGSPEARPILAHLARRDPEPEVREAAERALARLTRP